MDNYGARTYAPYVWLKFNKCKGGHVENIKVVNVPSFVDRLDATLDVAGIGTLQVHTAFGGDSFVIVDAESLGFSLRPDEAMDLATLGVRITAAANEQIGFTHPDNPDWSHISFCQFAAPIEREENMLIGRNAVAIDPGKIDRSPTGTGCSARLAVLHAQKKIGLNETFLGISIIGSKFYCKVEEALKMASGLAAIRPSITGRGFITGTHQHLLDPNDPWPEGYRLSDTWPNALP